MEAVIDVSPAAIRARQKEQRDARYKHVYTETIYAELIQRLNNLPENAAGMLAGQYRRQMYSDKYFLEWLSTRLAADFPAWKMTPSYREISDEFDELVVDICER